MNEPKLAKWLRWMIYATALIPLVIFAQFMSPFHVGKVLVFRTLIEIMLVLYVLLVWRDPSYLPKRHPILLAVFAFGLIFTITTITSVAPIQSWWGTLERMGGLFSFWHYIFFLTMMVSVLRTREHWQTLIDLTVCVAVVSALYGFLQKTHWTTIIGADGRTRPFGTIGNAALFAGYELLVLFFGVTVLLGRRLQNIVTSNNGWSLVWWGIGASVALALLSHIFIWLSATWVVPLGVTMLGIYRIFASSAYGRILFYRVALGIMLLAIIITAVRGSLLGIAIGGVVLLLAASTVGRSHKAKIFLLTLVAGLGVFVIGSLLFHNSKFIQSSSYLNRITDFSPATYTVQTRLWTWASGLQGWKETPKTILLGWGPENFNVPFGKHFNPNHFKGPGAETYFDRAHNMFIEVLVTMGIVGEIAYLAIFVALFFTFAKLMHGNRDQKALAIGGLALAIAYMVHNSFIFDTSANFVVFFVILGFFISEDQPATEILRAPVRRIQEKQFSTTQKISATVMILAMATMIFRFSIQSARANFISTRAIIAEWQNDWPKAISRYHQAIALTAPGHYEIRQRFAQYLLDVYSANPSKLPTGFVEEVQRAILALKQNQQENKSDYLPLLYLTRLYATLGKIDSAGSANATALDYANQALKLSPTFVRTYYEIAFVYNTMHDYDSAMLNFKKAAELNPDVALTWWYLATIKSQQASNTNSNEMRREALDYAKIAIEKGYGSSEEESLRIIDIAIKLNDIQSVVDAAKRLITINPNKITYWETLIAAQVRIGQNKEAIETIRAGLANPIVGADADFRAKAANQLEALGATSN